MSFGTSSFGGGGGGAREQETDVRNIYEKSGVLFDVNRSPRRLEWTNLKDIFSDLHSNGKSCEHAVQLALYVAGGGEVTNDEIKTVTDRLLLVNSPGNITARYILENLASISAVERGWSFLSQGSMCRVMEVRDMSATNKANPGRRFTGDVLMQLLSNGADNGGRGVSVKCSGESAFKRTVTCTAIRDDSDAKSGIEGAYQVLGALSKYASQMASETVAVRVHDTVSEFVISTAEAMRAVKLIVSRALCVVFDRERVQNDLPLFGSEFLAQVNWDEEGRSKPQSPWGVTCSTGDPTKLKDPFRLIGLSRIYQVNEVLTLTQVTCQLSNSSIWFRLVGGTPSTGLGEVMTVLMSYSVKNSEPPTDVYNVGVRTRGGGGVPFQPRLLIDDITEVQVSSVNTKIFCCEPVFGHPEFLPGPR